MTDPVPSKEQSIAERLRAIARGVCTPIAVRLAQIEEIADEIERLKRPAHEREPPHCSTCGCGLAPEPPAMHPCDDGMRAMKHGPCGGQGCDDCDDGVVLVLAQPPGAG